uniref:Uncharacterized protein n=1 Tax=Onchocerca volvulus TaxID=6282 RepID=A0A8R1TYA3_ONCVO
MVIFVDIAKWYCRSKRKMGLIIRQYQKCHKITILRTRER